LDGLALADCDLRALRLDGALAEEREVEVHGLRHARAAVEVRDARDVRRARIVATLRELVRPRSLDDVIEARRLVEDARVLRAEVAVLAAAEDVPDEVILIDLRVRGV